MRTILLGATLSLALAAGAMAQTGASPAAGPAAAASAVGHWLYSPKGEIIGSVRSVTDGGRTAVLMIGSYFRPGSYEERIRAEDLSVVDGKVILRGESALALNARSAQ